MTKKLSDDPKQHKLVARLIQQSRKDRPSASESWHVSNAVFKASNILGRKERP